MSNASPRRDDRATQRPPGDAFVARRATDFRRFIFISLLALIDCLTIIACFEAVGVAYHGIYLHVEGMAKELAITSLMFSFLFFIINAFRLDYTFHRYLFVGSKKELLFCWNITTIAMLFVGFLLKESSEFSRAAAFLSYVSGFVCLLMARSLIRFGTKRLASAGRLCWLRIVLVGNPRELKDFRSTYRPKAMGIDVVASAVLRNEETVTEDLALAVDLARVLRPDSIFILSPWSRPDWIEAAIGAFRSIPVAVHLGPQPLLTRFKSAEVHRVAGIMSLKLLPHPSLFFANTAKRALDLAVASFVSAALAPFASLIAIAIRLESKGPVFAHERLVGFNQQSFGAIKFCTTRDRRDHPGYKRSTRIERFLVGSRLEFLPRILNVIKGDMSLVGPRPKTLASARKHSKINAAYNRRYNVKPGLTGWTQIHALRAETISDQALQAHVDHDLFYVDQQNLTLDLRILAHRCLLPTAPDRRRIGVDLAAIKAREASRTLLFETTFGPNEHVRRKADLLGVDVDDLSLAEALRIARGCLADQQSRTLFFVNAHTLNLVSSSEVYRRIVERGHLVFGDGAGVRIAAAMRGSQLRANLNGTDFIPALLASAGEGYDRCYLLGGEQDIVAKAAEIIKQRFPAWDVVGHHHGFIGEDTNAAVIEDIQRTKPHLLLVGMGNPLQEYWIMENQEKLSVNLIVGVGALFSYISGDYRRAPMIMRRIGVEWLWVLVMQPHKWRRYVVGNPLFLRRAVMHACRKTLVPPYRGKAHHNVGGEIDDDERCDLEP